MNGDLTPPTPEILQPHDRWMRQALDRAQRAWEQDEVPIGAVIVHGERIIGEGWNQREMLHDPTAHAEMIALTQAAAALKSWRLERCILYVTLEPCPMCAGAIVQARGFRNRRPSGKGLELLQVWAKRERLHVCAM